MKRKVYAMVPSGKLFKVVNPYTEGVTLFCDASKTSSRFDAVNLHGTDYSLEAFLILQREGKVPAYAMA